MALIQLLKYASCTSLYYVILQYFDMLLNPRSVQQAILLMLLKVDNCSWPSALHTSVGLQFQAAAKTSSEHMRSSNDLLRVA